MPQRIEYVCGVTTLFFLSITGDCDCLCGVWLSLVPYESVTLTDIVPLRETCCVGCVIPGDQVQLLLTPMTMPRLGPVIFSQALRLTVDPP